MAEFDDRDEGRQDAFTAIGLTRLLANASSQSPGPCRPQARDLESRVVAIRRCPGSAKPIIETGSLHRPTNDAVIGDGFDRQQSNRNGSLFCGDFCIRVSIGNPKGK